MAGALRVLYSYPHVIGRPGIGTTAINQVRGLRAAGADVTVICAAVAPGVELPGARSTLVTWGRRIPHRAFGRVDWAWEYHDRLVASALGSGGFDVVHTWPSGALHTLRAAREAGVLGTREAPNTHTAHAYAAAAQEARTLGLSVARGQSHRPSQRRLRHELDEYEAAQLILVPSERVEQTFLEAGVPGTKLARHRYGFDPEAFHARGRDDGPGRPFTAVFLGSAEPRKGLHYALEAWRAADVGAGSRFLIAGSFAPGYRERIAELLAQPGVSELGFTDDAAALLRAGDVLVLPSIEEGSALVSYEAQASGCVPLVSRSAGSNFEAGIHGLVHEDRDVTALAGHIALMHDDTGTRARMRSAGLAAAPTLTWDAAGGRMLQLFEEAIGGA